MTFDEAMVLTRTVSSEAAFTDEECKAYFDVLMSLEPESLIVEVGLEYGRSSSIALQVAKERGLRYVGMDPFPDPAIANRWHEMAAKAGVGDPSIYQGESQYVMWFSSINALLIDGDHKKPAVRADCEHFLPYVEKGGHALFHDLPEVYPAVNQYMAKHPEWMYVQTVGSLGIYRRTNAWT